MRQRARVISALNKHTHTHTHTHTYTHTHTHTHTHTQHTHACTHARAHFVTSYFKETEMANILPDCETKPVQSSAIDLGSLVHGNIGPTANNPASLCVIHRTLITCPPQHRPYGEQSRFTLCDSQDDKIQLLTKSFTMQPQQGSKLCTGFPDL